MIYRIELKKIDRRHKAYDKNEYVYNVKEVKNFIQNCVDKGYRIAKIIKTTKDGRGYDVTMKYKNLIKK